MVPTIQILVLLLVVVASVAVVAARLKVPPAILLVLTGVALALVPGLPPVELSPELVLLLVLPPVIYWSAVSMNCETPNHPTDSCRDAEDAKRRILGRGTRQPDKNLFGIQLDPFVYALSAVARSFGSGRSD
jgi:hypothetical protein